MNIYSPELVIWTGIVLLIMMLTVTFFLKCDADCFDFSYDAFEKKHMNGEISDEKFEETKRTINKELEELRLLIS